jgi:hypothetical protein
MADNDLQPLLDTQQNHLSTLLAQRDSIDNRSLGLLGSVVAILIFIGQSPFVLEWWQWILLLLPYAVSLVYIIICLLPRAYVGVVVNVDQQLTYATLPRAQLVLQLISDTRLAVKHNTRLVVRLNYLLVRAFAWALIGTVVLAGVLVVQ